LIPRFNISSVPGSLPVLYSVPVQSKLVPAPSPVAFTAFADCKVQALSSTFHSAFSPLAYSDSA